MSVKVHPDAFLCFLNTCNNFCSCLDSNLDKIIINSFSRLSRNAYFKLPGSGFSFKDGDCSMGDFFLGGWNVENNVTYRNNTKMGSL